MSFWGTKDPEQKSPPQARGSSNRLSGKGLTREILPRIILLDFMERYCSTTIPTHIVAISKFYTAPAATICVTFTIPTFKSYT